MEQRDAMTVRFPTDLLSRAREVKAERESMNDFVVGAVDREIRRRQGLLAYDRILRVRERIELREGTHPDSIPLVRSLRDGEGRRD